MASSKNSSRRKRKYGDRTAKIDKNKARRQQREATRLERLAARTQALVGTYVKVRVKDHKKPLIGTVQDVIRKGHDDYPTEAERHMGSYLRIRTEVGDLLASRHRVKPVKDK